VRTLHYPDDDGDAPRTGGRRARRAFAELQHRALNFDPRELDDAGPATGWTVDDHRIALPPEAPGPPEPGGPWEVARELVRHYRFADPSLIEAVFRPDDGLEGRNMLLQGRFCGLRFLLGARVSAVTDEQETALGGRAARVWGWSYQTLEGHLEQGQMDFAVVKHLDDGGVEFRIHAVSRPARIPNPVVRVGFHMLGRRLQLRFARTACARMRRLVEEELRHGRDGGETAVAEVTMPPAGTPPDA
jgi:uncharacterized protein (UPF0548 family)